MDDDILLSWDWNFGGHRRDGDYGGGCNGNGVGDRDGSGGSITKMKAQFLGSGAQEFITLTMMGVERVSSSP